MPRTITIRHQIGFHADFPEVDLSKRPSAIGILQPGAIVPIMQEVEGLEFEKELSFFDSNGDMKKFIVKSNVWYQDKNGWWYWNGSTKTMEEAENDSDAPTDPIPGPTPDPTPPPVTPIPPVTIPEKKFNWKSKLKEGGQIPKVWFKHSGKGINIAILDAGFDLEDACFKHLRNNIKTYDLRKDNYDILSNIQNEDYVKQLDGKDKMPLNSHGTSCLGILGAKSPNKELMGIIPNANFHLFNVYEHHMGPFNTVLIRRSKELIEKAMWLISNMDMDIVTVSINYPNDAVFPDELISQTMQSDTLWFWALKSMTHPSLDKYILDPTYPNPFFPVQTIATLKKEQLSFSDNLIVTDLEQDKIDFIIQKNEISVIKGKNKINHNTKLECSFATPALAGLAALKINEHQKINPDFKINPKTFLKELKNEATRFYKDFIPDNDAFTFLRLNENPLV